VKAIQHTLDETREENEMLRDKLTLMEQEKANMMNDKERRERDCKNMQIELNRINSMVHVRLIY
jgi:3-phenylpropionate/cinnamic acid dioxygenase small subunit